MGFQVYKVGDRWAGYGVPAFCEHPDCNKQIDRGMSFACGGEPFSEHGCDRYFCEKHLIYACFDDEGTVDIEKGKNCTFICERCKKGEEPFDYAPEHPIWIEHVLTDGSWNQWKAENPRDARKLAIARNTIL
jgi:hypothetical protein